MPQSSLAEPLGIRQSSVSMKMKGNTAWSVADVVNAADFLGVLPEDLLDDSVLRSAQAKYGARTKKAAGGPAAVKLPQLGLNQRHFD
ncbi:helix-turn-helix domain-containing protein [Bifidobacterium tibiigranuli]|uniref:helix-turn-helix domain-containing protein n=1 Tax=Bifidobacterium tibiigranuli TaxID=2172043 RepID=UPI0034C64670